MKGHDLRELPGDYTVARLGAADAIPAWADGEGVVSITRNRQELSILCRSDRVPEHVRQDGGWICYHLPGPFAFDETGVVLSVIAPLSSNGIGIFLVSTFDGDHVLIKAQDRERAAHHLKAAGHRITPA